MKYRLKSTTSLLALTAALGVNTASAADMPTKMYQPPAVVAEPSWTGFYFGGSVGGAWDNLNETNGPGGIAASKLQSADLSGTSVVVGVHAGYNWEFNRWVVGVEGDISGLPFRKARIAPNATAGNVEASLSGLASLRGRIGYAFGQNLIYGTGGVGWIGENFLNVPGDLVSSRSHLVTPIQTVPVVGGGYEYKVTRNMTAGLEGLVFVNSGSQTLTNSTGRNYSFKAGNVTVVRAKVSFNW